MIEHYKDYIKSNEAVTLNYFNVPFFDVTDIKSSYWHKPYGDDDKDIYNPNALRSSTLNDDIKSKGWTGLVLKNHSGDWNDNAISNIHPSYDSIKDLVSTFKKFKGTWTKVADNLPDVRSYVEQNIEPLLIVGHVYILRVEPHGFIKEHRDIPSGYDEQVHKNYNLLNTFMVPLNDPSYSYFILNKKQINLQENKVTWFNSSLPHVYFNTSNDFKFFLLFTGLARKSWIEMTVRNML